MKEQSRASERELSREEITNLSDGEFQALVVKMLTDPIEFGQKVKKQMKGTQSEIKQNVQWTNSDGKETRTQINDLEQKEKNKYPSRSKWRNKNSKKWRDSDKPLGKPETFPYPNYRGARGEQQQEIGKLFEQIMKDTFPNMAE